MFELIPFGRREHDLFSELDQIERKFFGDFNSKPVHPVRTDIIEKDDSFVLKAELPGFDKEDINIEINNGILSISAEHNFEESKTEDNYVRRERHYGSFARSFDISNIKEDEISAEYKNGVLEIDMPKRSPEEPATKKIDIK